MNIFRRHLFADQPALRNGVQDALAPHWPAMPPLLRQAVACRLESSSLRAHSISALGFALTVSLTVFLTWMWYPARVEHAKAVELLLAAAVTLLALLAGRSGLAPFVTFARLQQPASRSGTLTALLHLSQACEPVKRYLDAVLNANEFPRDVDVAVARWFAARQLGDETAVDRLLEARATDDLFTYMFGTLEP